MFGNSCTYGRDCPQLLLTLSPHLCNAIKAHFKHLQDSWDLQDSVKGPLDTLGKSFSDFANEVDGDVSLDNIRPDDYPLFWTFDKLLRTIDRSVPGDRFRGFATASATSITQVIDEERFRTH